jgi:hypothetical protein
MIVFKSITFISLALLWMDSHGVDSALGFRRIEKETEHAQDTVIWRLELLDSYDSQRIHEETDSVSFYSLKRNDETIDTVEFTSFINEESYCRIDNYRFTCSNIEVVYLFLSSTIGESESIVLPGFDIIRNLNFGDLIEGQENERFSLRKEMDYLVVEIYFDGGITEYRVGDKILNIHFCPD